MDIIKRNGAPEPFNEEKIRLAIIKANNSVPTEEQMNKEQIDKVFNTVMNRINGLDFLEVDTVNDFIEKALIRHNRAAVAKEFILFRANKQKNSKFNDIEQQILTLLDCQNDDIFTENANKIATRTPVMQNYAAEVSLKSIASKLIPEDVMEHHKKGIIHCHDLSNYCLPEHNCDLLNIEDMLDNGFAMGIDTMIEVNDETPFSTIGNLVSQVHLNCGITQYGGMSTSLGHVVKYIDKNRQFIKKNEIKRQRELGILKDVVVDNIEEYKSKYGTGFVYDKNIKFGNNDESTIVYINDDSLSVSYIDFEKYADDVKKQVDEEIYVFIKTFFYQLESHLCAGQTPFCSTIMCLMESETKQELEDYAKLIETMLNRRLKGMKQYNMETNTGLWSSPLFPKLIYFVEEGWNLNPDDPYYYLTELAAKCISVRMQPDIMSTKISRELKQGLIIGTMGCRSILPPYFYAETYDIDKEFYYVKMDKDAEGVHQYPYGTWVDKKSFKDIPNGKYETGLEHGEYCINFRGNPGWLQEKTDDKVVIWRSKVYGRFNCGVTSINIPYCALLAKQESEKTGSDIKETFWKVFDEKLEVCHRAMRHRFEHVCTIKAENSPILWMHGGLTRMKKGETVGDFLKGRTGYASISLGYSGICETCWAILGVSNTHPDGHQFAREILEYMNKKCAEWRTDDGFAPSVYGTPQENLVKKFINSLKRDFGIVEHITDKDYVTNSYHVNPAERGGGIGETRDVMTAIKKIDLESDLQSLSSGGAISYIEIDDLSNNPDAIITLIRYMGNHIMYAEFNRILSVCFECGGQNTIDMRYEDGKYKFKCRECGNENEERMDVVARICGYLGKITSKNTSLSRLSDINARVVHVNCETEFPEEEYKK